MMRQFILFVLIISFSSYGFSPDKLSEEKRKEFEAQKVAFYTNFLELTPEESAAFWPLYNEMLKKIREKDQHVQKNTKEYLRSTTKDEAIARQLIEQRFTVAQEKLNIKKEYYARFLNVMPASKVLKIEQADHTFHKQLLNKMKGGSTPPKPGK